MTCIRNLSNESVTHFSEDGVEFIQFNHFNEYKHILSHCFTTRIGGVSSGDFYSLNFGANSGDDRENIEENYRRICGILRIEAASLVFSKQIHGCNIKAVDCGSRGTKISSVDGMDGCDGLMTDSKDVPLVTLYADCVPIFLFDPVKKAVALVHSGWRGTVAEIGKKAVELFQKNYGSHSADILAGIGPSIGKCCFEVDKSTADIFKSTFPHYENIVYNIVEGQKYKVDLWRTNFLMLADAGLKPSNISVAGICTVCNSDVFFSHRGSGGKKGRNAALIQLI